MIMTSYPEQLNDTVVRVSDEEFPMLMPRWGYVTSAFVLFIIGFFGFFLNLLVIVLMFKDRQLWTPLNIILLNLVCSDFSVSVLGNPFTLVSALFHRWVFGRTMCVLYGFFMALLGITSITTLTVISFERYLMVTRPLRSRHLTSKGAAILIIFIWVYSLALTAPPLMGWGNYVNEAANISCSVNWHEQSTNTLTYILFLFAMGQIVPLAVITFSYINIIRTLKKNSERLGRVSRTESRATAMIFLMIVAFTVAWTPYSLFALMEQFATEGIISPGLGVIPALIAKSSICYDPLIYVGMNTQFRQSIRRVFGVHSKGHSQTEKGLHNTVLSQKLSAINEITIRYNTSELNLLTTPQRDEKNKIPTDERADATRSDFNSKNHPKIPELSTIQENKTASDVERSGDVVYDDDSNSSTKMESFVEPCKLADNPLILKIVESESLLLSQRVKRNNNIKDLLKICSVQGLKIHSNEDIILDDNMEISRKLHTMKHSYSLDLSCVSNEGKRRKLSIETRRESFKPPQGF
ncbi:unnamed protein product [Parnassius apollo]|uniref:(apollo) hypothetical protein n=1 Tax=Parnassius apollo TaxID=110799 RepID=A0A8S3Y0R5_PARAO|nr:unnamed protein product [Parnassius apollo]